MTMKLRRLLAALLALAMLAGAALAEALEPIEDGAVEAPAEEQGELALPGDDSAEQPMTLDPDAAVLPPEAEPDPDAAVAAPGGAHVLGVGALTLGVREKSRLWLASGAQPRDVGAAFTSSDPKIAAVDADGLVTAKKVGSATIVMDVGGLQSSCAVTVLRAPGKITLSAKKLSMGAGEQAALGVAITPNSASVIQWTSDNPGAAVVDASGIVTAVGPGKATITAKTFNNRRAKCKVTVAAAPTYVTANVGALTLWVGRAFEIEPILSPGAGGSVACYSANPGIVAMDGLTARAQAQGSTTLTLVTYNGLRAEIPVTVSKAPVYRALVIGEGSFPDSGAEDLPGWRDVALMVRMLSSVRGPSGDPWNIMSATNLTAEQIHAYINAAYAGAQEGDVSLFYISTHGDQKYEIGGLYSNYAGCLMTYPDKRFRNWYDVNTVTLGRLAGWLCEVPGQMIVMIDSCGSGAAIYGAAGVAAPPLSPEDFDGQNFIEAPDFSPEAFDQAVVDAFRSLDAGVLAPGQGAFVLENKFFVLTSCAYRETGWSLKNRYSYFTKWLTDAVKLRGKMPADANKNRYTTLWELYCCMAKKAEKKVFRYEGVKYKQHVQVYPSGSGFELFYR